MCQIGVYPLQHALHVIIRVHLENEKYRDPALSLSRTEQHHHTVSEMADLTRRLDFLNDAAHLLARSAPETSSYLMMSRNSLLLENGLDRSDPDRQHSCGACGQIFIVGQTASLRLETVGKKAPRRTERKQKERDQREEEAQRVTSAPEAAVVKRFTCERCSAFTKISIAKPAMPKKTHSATRPLKRPAELPAKPAGQTVSATEEAATGKSAANASSKKRAKARKAGLQAILDESKKQSSLGNSLTLGHFLKKPA